MDFASINFKKNEKKKEKCRYFNEYGKARSPIQSESFRTSCLWRGRPFYRPWDIYGLPQYRGNP
jgi:hypothetical protein